MCERSLTLRVLVNARLTAAAEEIFALVERTIAEYEEEVCRCKEENQRKQQLLDSVLSPQVRLHRTQGTQDVKVKSRSPQRSPPALCAAERAEECPAQRFDFTVVRVKSEELEDERSSELQHVLGSIDRNEPNAERNHQEPERQKDSADFNFHHFQQNGGYSTDNSEEWGETSGLAKRLKTEDDVGESYGQTATERDFSADKVREHRCAVCGKVFTGRSLLKRHSVVHTGEKPFSCPVCNKGFSQNAHLKVHMCSHTGITPYRCALCGRGFTRRDYFLKHMGGHKRPAGPPHDRRVGPPHDRRVGPPHDRRVGPPHDRRVGPPHDRRVGPQFRQVEGLGEASSHGPEANQSSLFSCPLCQKVFLCKNDIEIHMELHRRDDT